jgi:ATP-dependent 26S proteasome regulatory subunit
MFSDLHTDIIPMIKFAALQPVINQMFSSDLFNEKIDVIIPFIVIYFIYIVTDNHWIYHNLILRLYYMNFNIYHSSLTLTGERLVKHATFLSRSNMIMTDEFRAVLEYIRKTHSNHLLNVKQWNNYTLDIDRDRDEDKNDDKNKSSFMVNQNWPIYIGNDIHLGIHNRLDVKETSNGYTKSECEVEVTELILYSYVKSTHDLIEFVENITNKYLKEQSNKRKDKIYDYYLESKEGGIMWNESKFESSKTFDNLFFDGKEEILQSINYFLNNKKEYYNFGVPYTLGIGLRGPPGTGKTSFIKALANQTRRHIITIPLNKIKTEDEFYSAFMNNYRIKDGTRVYDFDEKIIVLEDIDCMSDIVYNREKNVIVEESNENKNVNIKDMLRDAIEEDSKSFKKSLTNDENRITLSFILNIIDGIREHSGRILIITSNHYDKLDPALVRPGRIDISLEMKKASIDLIKDMYKFYYKTEFPKKFMNKLQSNKVAPCEIVNMRRNSMNKKDFLKKLINAM